MDETEKAQEPLLALSKLAPFAPLSDASLLSGASP
jgi:hypothetical protein